MIIIIWGTDTGFPKWRVKSGEKKRKRRHETNIIYNKKKWKRNEYREGKKTLKRRYAIYAAGAHKHHEQFGGYPK